MEFHKLRFPEHTTKAQHKSEPPFEELYAEIEIRRNRQGNGNYHQRKKEFLNWFGNHKARLESPGFKSYYSARERAKEAKQRYFTDLHGIQFDYTFSLTSVADWQSALEPSYKDDATMLNLAQDFLTEIAIYESAFLQVYGSEFETVEFETWSQRNKEFLRAYSVIMMDGLSLDSRQEQDCSREIIDDARARAKQNDLSSEHLQLMHQELKRLSGTGPDLEFERSRASVIDHHIREKGTEQSNPPSLLAGVKRALQQWHDAGRHLSWDSLALREIQESKEFLELLGHDGDERSKDDEDYAEYLWHHTKHGYYKP